MRKTVFAFGLTLLLTACSGSGGYIQGKVHVAKGHGGFGVFAAVWQVPAVPEDPNNPASPLVAQLGAPAQFVGDLALGVTTDDEGTFSYSFHSLDRGLYFVGAFLDSGQNPSPDLTLDLHQIDFNSPIEIDPSTKDKASVTHDLFLGESAPGTGTIKGTVHLSNRAAGVTTWVLVLSGNPFSDGNAQLLMQQGVPSGTADVQYELFNVPIDSKTPTYVMAVSDINQNGTIDFGEDLIGLRADNPVLLSTDMPEQDNVDLWVERQADNLGSIQGTVKLNAPLADVSLTLMLFSTDYSKNAGANVVNVVNLSAASTDTIPFQFSSVPLGQMYMLGLIRSASISATAIGQLDYTGTGINPAPIAVSQTQANVTGINFPMGVGLVTGNITLTNAPTDLQEMWVVATQTQQGTIYLKGYADIAVTPGTSSYSYDVFGLLDGQYDMSLVIDTDHTGSLNDALNDSKTVTKTGSKSPVTISGGGREGSDFSVSF